MSLFAELKRRNVFRVAAAYLVLSWLLMQIADTLGDMLSLPDWSGRLVLLLLAVGFLPALVFAWVFELTPDGLKRESEIDRQHSVTHQTGRKLDYFTIAAAALAVAVVVWDRFSAPPAALVETPVAVQTTQPEGTAEMPSSAPAGEQSIAVLPFVNMSGDPENEYFADGLSEELLNQLAQVPGLRVAGRTSSFAFKGDNQDLRDIGEKLGVANILEGSVRHQGDRVRITAQLITASDGTHLWSEAYDRLMEDVFAVQDDIAQRVVSALDIVLNERARQRMLDVGVRDVEAFVAYQKGLDLFWDAHEAMGTPDSMAIFEQALEQFEKATEKAPGFAQAWLDMADYYAHLMSEPGIEQSVRGDALVREREVLEAGLEAARTPLRRAMIQVDQTLFSDHWQGLKARLDTAVSLRGCAQPNWIELGLVLGYAEALQPIWEEQIRCDPIRFYFYGQLSVALVLSGRGEEALAVLDRFVDVAGHSRWVAENRVFILMAMGELERALSRWSADPAEADRLEDVAPAVALLAASNRIEDARAVMDRLPVRADYIKLGQLAMIGDRDAANELAATLDAMPAGPWLLLNAANACYACGAPFDLEATPNFRARIEESGLPWPPEAVIRFPAKDW